MRLYLDNCVFNRPYDDQSSIRVQKTFIFHKRGASMMTDTEIRRKGAQILYEQLGDIEMERFIALIQREPFDYTNWREAIDTEDSLEAISQKAMQLRAQR